MFFSTEYSEKMTENVCFNLTNGSDQQQCLPYLEFFWSSANISVYEACRLVSLCNVVAVVVKYIGLYTKI